jgi:anion-transporting  ArsA/GET3 family ATPase
MPNCILASLLKEKRVMVCCGAGGVGKTTTAAALACAGARLGQRVLVLTIDPSKRLAQTLGITQNTTEPVVLADDRLAQLGIQAPGSLSAWLLDPQYVSNQVVKREAKDSADTLMSNLIYQEISGMVAGMQEYTAIEALYQFIQSEHYDLIILDTPPSRHALRFLDAPKRVASFLDKRIFKLFVPDRSGFVGRMAGRVLDEVLDRAFGMHTRQELQEFFELFSQILDHLNHNQAEMNALFRSSNVTFFLVTSAQSDVIDEAVYFQSQASARALPFAGFFLNRNLAITLNTPAPTVEDLVDIYQQELEQESNTSNLSLKESKDLMVNLVQKLQSFIAFESLQKQASQTATIALQKRGEVYAIPDLGKQAADLTGIAALADYILNTTSHS